MIDKFMKYIKNPLELFLVLGNREFLNWIDDEKYIKIAHRIKLNEKLDLENPITYNQKLQWLKIYNRDVLYNKLVDKYRVREFIKERIGSKYLIPLIGVWENVEDIDFNSLPNQFVLKCTHNSGGLVICKDKRELNIKSVKDKLEKSLKHNYYWGQREWVYKDVPPLIIAEKYIADDSGKNIRDYRFFCFNGEPKFISVDLDIINKDQTRRNIYDLEWNLLDIEISYPKEENKKLLKPKNLEIMIEIAKELSKDIPHLRVDLYNVDGKILFGELTFFHQSGWGKFNPKKWDEILGNWLTLPEGD